MGFTLTEQGIIVLFSCAVGIIIGLLYDVFRIIRIAFNSKNISVFFQDLLFCLLTSGIILLLVFYTNSGKVRWFSLFGCFLFFYFYYITVGRIVIYLSTKIINLIKAILNFILNITVKPILKLYRFIVSAMKKTMVRIKELIRYRYEKQKIVREIKRIKF